MPVIPFLSHSSAISLNKWFIAILSYHKNKNLNKNGSKNIFTKAIKCRNQIQNIWNKFQPLGKFKNL